MITKEQIEKKLDDFYFANDITFNEKDHTYKLDGITCAGVSSISEYMPKDYLKPWAAKMVVEFLKGKLDNIKEMGQKEFEDLLKIAKDEYIRDSNKALDIGTKVHDWIEKYTGLRATGTKVTMPYSLEAMNPVEEFLKFESVHKVKWLVTEKIVCDPEHLVAGRLDAIAIVDERLALVDFKTSKQVSESHLLQTGGYKMCLEAMGIEVDDRIVLRLPKKVGDGFEAISVETDYKKDKKAFLNQRYAREWANYVDVHFKEDVWYGNKKGRKLKLKQL